MRIEKTNDQRIEALFRKAQHLRMSKLDPELKEKLNMAQTLLAEVYLRVEKRAQRIMSDYSFLTRDHVFFDGDNSDHSGAV